MMLKQLGLTGSPLVHLVPHTELYLGGLIGVIIILGLIIGH